jgi:hypothetical protein
VINYFRKSPDGRLIFGGGENYRPGFPPDLKSFVRRRMLKIYPDLADVAVTHAWGGTLGITVHRAPFVRELAPGVRIAAGYSGQGVMLAPWFGKLLADAALGEGEGVALLARLPTPPFPGGRLLRWPLTVAGLKLVRDAGSDLGQLSRRGQQRHVKAQLFDAAIEEADVAVGAGLHDRPFHRGQDELRQAAQVQAPAAGAGPRPSDSPRWRRSICENWPPAVRAPADRARAAPGPGSRSGSRTGSRSPAACRDRPPAGRRSRSIGSSTPRQAGSSSICLDAVAVHLQHPDQHVLLAREEVVEAAAVGLRPREDVRHRGRAVALGGEQLHRRQQDASPGVEGVPREPWRLA